MLYTMVFYISTCFDQCCCIGVLTEKFFCMLFLRFEDVEDRFYLIVCLVHVLVARCFLPLLSTVVSDLSRFCANKALDLTPVPRAVRANILS